MHRSKWYFRVQSVAAQCLALGLLTDFASRYVWEFPVVSAGLTLGALVGIGNALAWRHEDRASSSLQAVPAE